jgi:hypothetical protein
MRGGLVKNLATDVPVQYKKMVDDSAVGLMRHGEALYGIVTELGDDGACIVGKKIMVTISKAIYGPPELLSECKTRSLVREIVCRVKRFCRLY